MSIGLRPAVDATDWASARNLVEEYAASLGVDLSFQGFDDELARLSDVYGPPRGAFILAEASDVVGCVGLRPVESLSIDAAEHTAEIKRLYVRPSCRGHGVGKRLLEHVLALASGIGYERVVLDTLPTMLEARALYEAAGFEPIAPYRLNPVPGAAFYGRTLTRGA